MLSFRREQGYLNRVAPRCSAGCRHVSGAAVRVHRRSAAPAEAHERSRRSGARARLAAVVRAGHGGHRRAAQRRRIPGRRARLAPGAAHARDGARGAAGRRHLPGPLLRRQPADQGAAGPVQAGLVVPHHIRRTGRALDVPAQLSRHQLPGRDLAQRAPDRRQQAGRGHVRRSHAGRVEVDRPRPQQHPRRQGHPGAGAAGRRRCGAGRQLVRLDQLELPRLPGAR